MHRTFTYFLFATLAATSVAVLARAQYIHTNTLSSIVRFDGVLQHHSAESSPLVFNDKLIAVLHDSDANPPSLVFRDYETTQELARRPWPNKYPSAIVDNDQILVFGAQADTRTITLTRYNTDFQELSRTALITLDQVPFNTSVIYDGRRYVMAIEVPNDKGGQFYPIFMTAKTIAGPWLPLGTPLRPDEYTACPTVRYVDGQYYIFYLAMEKLRLKQGSREYGFVTRAARTKDFQTYTFSPQTVLSYRHSSDGINTSDIDLIEFKGNVFILYNAGIQEHAISDIRRAYYPGTMTDLVHELFDPSLKQTLRKLIF